jgi:hypothetical protein
MLAAVTPAAAETVRLECTADTVVSSYAGERDFNYGRSTRLRFKGIQMQALLNFDFTAVRGWKVQKATLHLRYAGADQKLRTLGLSTISSPWSEGTGAGEKKPGEACFNARRQGDSLWAGPQSDFTDVSFSGGHTLTSYADARLLGDGWIAVDVDPRIIQANLLLMSTGIAVSDEKGQTMANNDVYSREQSNSKPYLVVEGGPAKESAPGEVSGLKVEPAPDAFRSLHHGAARLTFTGPANAFGYEVLYNLPEERDHRAARSDVPFATRGRREEIILRNLTPGVPLANIRVIPVTATGLRGEAAAGPAFVPEAIPTPKPLPPVPLVLGGFHHPAVFPLFKVWAYGDTQKAHPVTGELLNAPPPPPGQRVVDYRLANPVWLGRTVRLNAARNEIVAFHLAVENLKPEHLLVAVKPQIGFEGPGGGWRSRPAVFREWYVKDGDWHPEVCVPHAGPERIPAEDNGVPGQRNQSFLIEFHVPRTAAPGTYRSWISIEPVGGEPQRIPLEVEVNGLTLPDTLSFDVSLNTYGTVGRHFGIDDRTEEYRALETAYHRLAHAHRTTFAPLGYSHTGTTSTNYAPPLEGEGADRKVKDWSAWDRQFGAYLDGSAFAGLPREGVPLTHLYLPFNEAWPTDIRQHYRYTPTVLDYPATIVEHALKAPPIEEALPESFAKAFTAVMRQFADHCREKGWTQTRFHYYLNNKNYYKDPKTGGKGTSWWLLDEPNYRDDWLAIAYFARLFRAGTAGVKDVHILHREDLSRPQWQRDFLDGLVDLIVVSGELFQKQPLLKEMRHRYGATLWNYGSAHPVRESSAQAQAWAVRAWLAGAEAIVPWQTVGSDENFVKAEETALILPGKRFELMEPLASLRLKALRRAQQDVEYLVLLSKAKGWNREQIAAAVADILNLQMKFEQKDAEDAGTYRFGSVSPDGFTDLRRAIVKALSVR